MADYIPGEWKEGVHSEEELWVCECCGAELHVDSVGDTCPKCGAEARDYGIEDKE